MPRHSLPFLVWQSHILIRTGTRCPGRAIVCVSISSDSHTLSQVRGGWTCARRSKQWQPANGCVEDLFCVSGRVFVHFPSVVQMQTQHTVRYAFRRFTALPHIKITKHHYCLKERGRGKISLGRLRLTLRSCLVSESHVLLRVRFLLL